MVESESTALPLGDTPMFFVNIKIIHQEKIFVNTFFQKNQKSDIRNAIMPIRKIVIRKTIEKIVPIVKSTFFMRL